MPGAAASGADLGFGNPDACHLKSGGGHLSAEGKARPPDLSFGRFAQCGSAEPPFALFEQQGWGQLRLQE
jgi:hypothetical protein